MKAISAFAARVSKALGSVGGGGLGLLITLGLSHFFNVHLPPAAAPIVGSVVGTFLAPPNSTT